MNRHVNSVSGRPNAVYERIREILETARATVARTVNTTQVVSNWLIGREIVEEEQHGRKRAGYGDQLIATLSARLSAEFGRGYSVDNLELCRKFFLAYPRLLGGGKSDTACRISPTTENEALILYAASKESWLRAALRGDK